MSRKEKMAKRQPVSQDNGNVSDTIPGADAQEGKSEARKSQAIAGLDCPDDHKEATNRTTSHRRRRRLR